MMQEVQGSVPIADMTLKVGWLDKFMSGDSKVVSEITMAVCELSDRFTVLDIPTLKDMMLAHTSTLPSPSTVASMEVKTAELEKANFDCQLAQMRYDLQACNVYIKKVQNFTSAVQLVKLEHRVTAKKHNQDTIAKFMATYAILSDMEGYDVVREFTKYRSDLEKKLQVTTQNMVLGRWVWTNLGSRDANVCPNLWQKQAR
jgi:hypothetical protein